MTSWEEFNSDDLAQIRSKVNYKYERALVLTLAFSIPLFFVSPYIPGRRSGPLIERMNYWDAVLFFMIFYIILLAIVVVYKKIRAKKDYERISTHLKITIKSDTINRIGTPILDTTYKNIYFREIGKHLIDKDLLNDIKPGDKAEIRLEVNSGAVLSLIKVPPT